MTWRIRKAFTFDAAHQLLDLPPEHKCGRLHGHTYRVEITLKSTTLDDVGFVHDFGDLNQLKRYIDDVLDHRCLNDVVTQPTSEHLAMHLYYWCMQHIRMREGVSIDCIAVSETPNTWAEYRLTKDIGESS